MISSPPALQLYTLREILPTGRTEVLGRVAEFGYGAVEPYDVLTDPEQLRADLDETGLAVSSVHANILSEDGDAMADSVRRLFELTVEAEPQSAEHDVDDDGDGTGNDADAGASADAARSSPGTPGSSAIVRKTIL